VAIGRRLRARIGKNHKEGERRGLALPPIPAFGNNHLDSSQFIVLQVTEDDLAIRGRPSWNHTTELQFLLPPSPRKQLGPRRSGLLLLTVSIADQENRHIQPLQSLLAARDIHLSDVRALYNRYIPNTSTDRFSSSTRR
jgi:hypothetical protein